MGFFRNNVDFQRLFLKRHCYGDFAVCWPKQLKYLTKNPFFNVKALLLGVPGRKYEMISPRKNRLQAAFSDFLKIHKISLSQIHATVPERGLQNEDRRSKTEDQPLNLGRSQGSQQRFSPFFSRHNPVRFVNKRCCRKRSLIFAQSFSNLRC